MRNEQLSPIDADLWFERFGMIANGQLRSLEQSLRHAFHLVQLTPEEFRRSVRLQIDESTFEVMLDARRFDEAASNLIAYPSPPAVAAAGSSPVEAHLSCLGCGALFSGTGDRPGSATLGCCLDYISRLANPGWCDPAAHPCLPEGRYALRRPLILQ